MADKRKFNDGERLELAEKLAQKVLEGHKGLYGSGNLDERAFLDGWGERIYDLLGEQEGAYGADDLSTLTADEARDWVNSADRNPFEARKAVEYEKFKRLLPNLDSMTQEELGREAVKNGYRWSDKKDRAAFLDKLYGLKKFELKKQAVDDFDEENPVSSTAVKLLAPMTYRNAVNQAMNDEAIDYGSLNASFGADLVRNGLIMAAAPNAALALGRGSPLLGGVVQGAAAGAGDAVGQGLGILADGSAEYDPSSTAVTFAAGATPTSIFAKMGGVEATRYGGGKATQEFSRGFNEARMGRKGILGETADAVQATIDDLTKYFEAANRKLPGAGLRYEKELDRVANILGKDREEVAMMAATGEMPRIDFERMLLDNPKELERIAPQYFGAATNVSGGAYRAGKVVGSNIGRVGGAVEPATHFSNPSYSDYVKDRTMRRQEEVIQSLGLLADQ